MEKNSNKTDKKVWDRIKFNLRMHNSPDSWYRNLLKASENISKELPKAPMKDRPSLHSRRNSYLERADIFKVIMTRRKEKGTDESTD